MSGITARPLIGLAYAKIVSKWGWFVALGVALLALGIIALGDVVAVTLFSVMLIGIAFLVGGVAQVIHAFATKHSGLTLVLNLIAGVVYVAGGVLIMQEPVTGSVWITIFLLISLAVGGVVRIVLALRHREVPGWWVLALGGAVSVALGVALFSTLPWSGLWVLGTLIGVELLVQGISWLQFGLALRRMHRSLG